MPPSTRNVDAVMNDASSLARNVTAAAISSASAKRPIGTCTRRRAARSGSLANSSCSIGVFTGPGHTALTRMPSRANLLDGVLAAQVHRGQVDVLHAPPRVHVRREDRVVVRR